MGHLHLASAHWGQVWPSHHHPDLLQVYCQQQWCLYKSPITHLDGNFLYQEALLNTLATINIEIKKGIIMRISSDIQLNNLALPPRSAGAAGQNILFTGTETNCQIKINSVKNEQSGDWVCR